MKLTNIQKKEAHKLMSSKGGNATVKKIGKKGMSEIGKKGAQVRWGKPILQDTERSV